MKKFLLVCLSAMTLLSCDDILRFDVDMDTSFEIPANSVVPLPSFLTPAIETNAEGTFEDNGTSKNLVKEVRLTELTLTCQNQSDNFNFIEDIEVYITADGEDEVLMASVYDLPNDGSRTVSLNTLEEDLDRFIKKDEFKLRVDMTADQTKTSGTPVDCDMVFNVKADPL